MSTVAANTTLRVLILEDNPSDVKLVLRGLKRDGIDLQSCQVQSEADYVRELDKPYDLILADYSLPSFDALRALYLLRERNLDIPFIVVTGSVGEEVAVACIKQGAADYLLKDRLERLGPAVKSALDSKRLRDEKAELLEREREAWRKLQASEARFRSLVHNSSDIITLLAADGTILYESDPVRAVLGYEPEARVGTNFFDYLHEGDFRASRELSKQKVSQGDLGKFMYRVRDNKGAWRWCESVVTNLLQDPTVRALIVNSRDVSDRKQAEEQIRLLNHDLQVRLARLTALHAIDVAITGSVDLQLTLGVVLEQVCKQLGTDAATILLYREQSQTLEYGAGRGFGGKTFRGTRLRLGQGQAGRAALEHEVLHLSGPDEMHQAFKDATRLQREGFAAYWAVPLMANGELQGVLELFHRVPLEPDDDWHDFLNALATQAAIAIQNATLFKGLQKSNLELTLAYDTTIEGWARALDLKDEETAGHSERVMEMTVALARHMGFGEIELVHIRRGALLHDIGKMGVPDSILLKPGKLTAEEWEVMKRHTTFGYELLTPIGFLLPALDIPYCHHEKWDGSGYPRGLAGQEIPLAARIFAVVDVYDALSSDRPYRTAWPKERVMAHIRELCGTHFDPAVVSAFLSLVEAGDGRVSD